MSIDGTVMCIKIIIILLALNDRLVTVRCSAPTNLLVTRVGPCLSADDSFLVSVSELSVVARTYASSVSGRFNITEDISNGWEVKVTMQKCQDIRNQDTCDYFRSFQLIHNGCQRDDDDPEAELYNMFFRHTQPRLSCPIKAGRYRIEAFPFQTEDNYITVSESKISTSVFGYTFKIEGYLRRRKLLCLEAYMQLLYIHEGGSATPVPAAAPPAPAPADAEEDSAEIY